MSKANDIFSNIEEIAGDVTERKQPPVNNSQQQPVNNAPPTNNQPAEFYKDQETEDIEQEKIKPKIEDNGTTGAFLVGSCVETIFTFAERIMYLQRFSKKEKERLILMEEKSEDEFDNDDKRLQRKFLAIGKKHDKIKEQIPITKKEDEALKQMFTEYAKATGKSMNPQLMIYSVLIKLLVNRSVEIFM